MRVALGQFAVSRSPDDNLATTVRLMRAAVEGGADLLVLPEGVLARDLTDPDLVLKAAQPLDGPFMQGVLAESTASPLTVQLGIHVPNGHGKVYNVLATVSRGRIVDTYRKLHLYDAFAARESTNVEAGDSIPAVLDIGGMKVGTMTCYDVRFPELARRLALDGAEVLVLPAAWVKGPGKEAHWEVMVTARALENTCYVVAVGECGERNIGASMVVDPLGVKVAAAGEAPSLVFADLDAARVAHARRILPVLANRRFAPPTLAG